MSGSQDKQQDLDVVGRAPIIQIGSFLLVLLLLLKAYAVSGYSLTTTGALVSHAPLSVLLGMVASYEYVALPLLAVGAAGWVGTRGRTHAGWQRATAAAVAVVALLLSPWQYAIPIVGGALTSMALGLILIRRSYRTTRLVGIYVMLVVVTFFLHTAEKPWVPAEVLDLEQPAVIRASRGRLVVDQHPVVFVLEEGAWITALNAHTRFVMQIPADQVVSRTICHQHGQLAGARPIISVLLRRPYRSPNTSCDRLRQVRAAAS